MPSACPIGLWFSQHCRMEPFSQTHGVRWTDPVCMCYGEPLALMSAPTICSGSSTTLIHSRCVQLCGSGQWLSARLTCARSMVGWDPTMVVPWSKTDAVDLSSVTTGAGAWLGGRAAVPMHYLDEVDRGSWLPWHAITRPLRDQYGGLDDDNDDPAEVGWAIFQASQGAGSRLQRLTSSNRILCEDPGALVPVLLAVRIVSCRTYHAACLRG